MYKELGDGNLLSDNIENGEVFPVGGSRFGIIDTHMQVDYDSFSELFGLIEKNAKYLMSVPTIKSWYENQKSDLDFSLFCHMMAFNNVIKLKYPDIINMHNHNRFYEKIIGCNRSKGLCLYRVGSFGTRLFSTTKYSDTVCWG